MPNNNLAERGDVLGCGGVTAILVGLVVTVLACGILSYATNLGGFWVDTQVNNHYIQPLQRSKLDADASYRRSIEVQAQGFVARYTAAKASYPTDVKNLATWLDHNASSNSQPWSFQQSQEYANLKAQVDADTDSITNAATSYNALVNNPDNAGLFDFDPQLPKSLDPTIPQ